MESSKSFYLFLSLSIGLHCVALTGINLPSFLKTPQNSLKTDFIYTVVQKELEVKSNPRELEIERFKLKKNVPQYAHASLETLHRKDISPATFDMPPVELTGKKEIFIKNIEKKIPNYMTNKFYTHYYETVREKIKMMAFKNFTFKEEGEAFVTFVVKRTGELQAVKVNSEKSWGSPHLQLVAKKSVRDASPFPQFPEDLNFPFLTFNVIISFQYN